MMTAERILVTGGAGFIGSHLVEALLEHGYSVRVLDDLSTGKLSNLPIDRCHLTLVVGDVADASTVARAMKDCTAVVHLAAVASVQASVDDPIATHQSNFIGTLNICEAMRQAGVRRVVYASSAAIYGNNVEGTAISEDTPKNPLTPYAADKLASEHFLDFYRRQHGLEPVILRFFNIYGPRQDPSSPYSGVISIFSERAQKNSPSRSTVMESKHGISSMSMTWSRSWCRRSLKPSRVWNRSMSGLTAPPASTIWRRC